MDTLEIEDTYTDVLEILKERVGAKVLKEWGYMTVKEWVRDAIEQGETSPSQIVKDILLDYKLSL